VQTGVLNTEIKDGQCTCNVTLWRIHISVCSVCIVEVHVAGNNKTYLCLHAKFLMLLSNFNQICSSSTDFLKVTNIKFYKNHVVVAVLVCAYVQADMTELIRHFSQLCDHVLKAQTMEWGVGQSAGFMVDQVALGWLFSNTQVLQFFPVCFIPYWCSILILQSSTESATQY
jgi:hypothetical protein